MAGTDGLTRQNSVVSPQACPIQPFHALYRAMDAAQQRGDVRKRKIRALAAGPCVGAGVFIGRKPNPMDILTAPAASQPGD